MCDAHNECSGQEWTTNKHAMVRHEDKGSIKRYLESVIRKQHSRYRRDPPMVAWGVGDARRSRKRVKASKVGTSAPS